MHPASTGAFSGFSLLFSWSYGITVLGSVDRRIFWAGMPQHAENAVWIAIWLIQQTWEFFGGLQMCSVNIVVECVCTGMFHISH